MKARRVLTVSTLLATAAISTPARAQEPSWEDRGVPLVPLVPSETGLPFPLVTPRPGPRDPYVRPFLTLDLGGVDWFRQLPSVSFASDPTHVPGRDVAARPLPRTPNALLGRGGIDTGLRIGDRWLFPVLGINLGLGMLGANPTTETSSDGSMVTVRPRVTQVTFLLPGVGLAGTHRRWAFSASVRPLAIYTAMRATVASSGETTDVIADTWSLGLRADLEACRRVDPTQRLCLVVSPHVYESGFGNGGSMGLRWEIGR